MLWLLPNHLRREAQSMSVYVHDGLVVRLSQWYQTATIFAFLWLPWRFCASVTEGKYDSRQAGERTKRVCREEAELYSRRGYTALCTAYRSSEKRLTMTAVLCVI